MVAAPHRATLADLKNTPDDGRKYELIDGVIVVSAAPSWIHQAVVGELHFLLLAWIKMHPVGAVRPAPVDIVLSDRTGVQPDIVFVSTERLSSVQDGRFHGAPDLVVEVLSPTNRSHDTVTKLFHYARAGVPEYWLADPVARAFDILRLDAGMYVPQQPAPDGSLASVVLPGLNVDPDAIFTAAGLPGAND